MAGEFRIKTGLLLGSSPSAPVTSITDSSLFTNDSSTLATVNAIKGYTDGKIAVVDTSIQRIDTSINNVYDITDIPFVREASLGNSFVWDGSVLDVSVEGGTGGSNWSLDGSILSPVEQTASIRLDNFQYMGNPTVDGSWRFYINGDGDLAFEKRVTGTWTEGGKFTI